MIETKDNKVGIFLAISKDWPAEQREKYLKQLEEITMFKVGDLVKIKSENRVFKVYGFTDDGSRVIPPGWLIDEEGFSINPKFCKKYTGATSCLNLNNDGDNLR